jgi:nicotinamidase-related amidase
MSVDATARAAADLGFKLMVAEDACATCALTYGNTTITAEHAHKAFLAALKSYGQVMPVEQILAHLAAEQVK